MLGKMDALIIHGGAPTAVMNASLYGAVCAARESGAFAHFYAALGGSSAVLKEKFFDLFTVSEEDLVLLLSTPASAIGTSRDMLRAPEYAQIAKVLAKHHIDCVLFTGGNGSMDACGKVYRACADIGAQVNVIGIPKTIDNDLSVTDHAPGYGSAARYLAATVSEISQDVRALPIHVCIVEAMGRNCGWLAAASALARSKNGDGPDLIYLPERPFDEEEFLARVQQLHKEKGGVLVVASEGLHDAKGQPIVEPVLQVGRATYYGDVSAHLANLVIRRLGIKARGEKPGIAGRASIAFQSVVDRKEAEQAGRAAVRAAVEGKTGVMVGFERLSTAPYNVKTVLIPIEQVMLEEKLLPGSFISADGCDVTAEFVNWCTPLIGGPLQPFVTFQGRG